MSFRPIQIESPVNQMAAIAQLRGAQEASQMNALKMQEYQQQQREKNELARIMGDSNLAYGSEDFMRQVLARAPSQYETIATRIAQREDIKERTAKREFETQKLKADLKQRQLEEFKTAQKDISAFNSIQEVKDDIDRKVGSGLLPEDMAANILAGLPTDDGKFPAWKKQTLMKLMTAEKQLEFKQPKPEKVDLGGKVVVLDMNPNSDTYMKPIREETKTSAPASITDPELVKEYKFATDPARGKDRFTGSLLSFKEAVARAGRTPAQSDNPAKVAHTSTDDQGNVTFYNAFGQVIRKETNAGKRSPNVIKAEQAQKNLSRDIERTTNELVEITKDGGLIDQSTGSYAGKAIDIGARVFGKATSGDIAAGKLAPISDMVLKMVPRFEGPQSDKDTKSYKEAAGQLADTTLPREIRKAAGKEILRLMRERKKEFGVEGMEVAPDAPDPLGIR
jgi:hypothetical protein